MNIKQVEQDIKNNGESAESLYLATSQQISTLIYQGKIDDIYGRIAADCREEMAFLLAESVKEW